MSTDGLSLVLTSLSLNKLSVNYHCVRRWLHLMVSYYSNSDDVIMTSSTAKRYNELYPKKESKKESKKDKSSSTVIVQSSPKKKKEAIDGDGEQVDEKDDVPKPPKFKDPYADLPEVIMQYDCLVYDTIYCTDKDKDDIYVIKYDIYVIK